MAHSSITLDLGQRLLDILAAHTGATMARIMLEASCTEIGLDDDRLAPTDLSKLLPGLAGRLRLYVRDPAAHARCVAQLDSLKPASVSGGSTDGLESESLSGSLLSTLTRGSGSAMAKMWLDAACRSLGLKAKEIRSEQLGRLVGQLSASVKVFVRDPHAQRVCLAELERFIGPAVRAVSSPAPTVLLVATETDVVVARGHARKLCDQVGFSETEQVRVATVVSELARNMVMYAGGGKLTLTALSEDRPGVRVVAEDQGQGIPDLASVLAGRHRSKTGMGMGLIGSKRLMDQLDIHTAPGAGTRVTAIRYRR